MISVGIDVSKEKSMVCILKPYGEIIASPFVVDHTETGIGIIKKLLSGYDEEIKIVLEATGHYHMPIVQTLLEAGYHVSVINPLVMKKYTSLSIRKGKTDRKDAIKIAEYGISNWFNLRTFEISKEVYEELKILSRQYYQYLSIKTKCKVNLSNILDKAMPGIKKLLKDDKLLSFIRKYWHFDNVKSKSEKQFIRSYSTWIKKEGYHQSEIKAKEIYALALNSIPTLNSNYRSSKLLVLESVRVLQEIEDSCKLILAQMKELAINLKEYETVKRMSGVGDVLSLRLIAEVGDVRRFHSKKALIAYAGIDAPPYESGNFVGNKCHISKRGSKYLRKTGYEIMLALKKTKPTKDNAAYEYILKKELEGKSKKAAKIAGLNKFLRIYYARVMELYT
ncbi:IS110 family transposase [Mycoplasmatota bacterium WC44]